MLAHRFKELLALANQAGKGFASKNRLDLQALESDLEDESLLRAACILVDEQIQLAIGGGNRSIERASMMAALKIAGDLIKLQNNQTQQSPSSNVSSDEVARLQAEIHGLEEQVDNLLQTLSLPGSPRPIVP